MVLLNFATILLEKRRLVGLLQLSSCCSIAVCFPCLLLAVSLVGLRSVRVAFHDHIQLLLKFSEARRLYASQL